MIEAFPDWKGGDLEVAVGLFIEACQIEGFTDEEVIGSAREYRVGRVVAQSKKRPPTVPEFCDHIRDIRQNAQELIDQENERIRLSEEERRRQQKAEEDRIRAYRKYDDCGCRVLFKHITRDEVKAKHANGELPPMTIWDPDLMVLFSQEAQGKINCGTFHQRPAVAPTGEGNGQ